MDLTRDFVEKLEEMSVPHQIEHGGRLFTDKQMTALPCGPVADHPLATETLSSVVDYLVSSVDGNVLKGRPVVHVSGPEVVHLYMEMDSDKRRDHPLSAIAEVNKFPFGNFMPLEDFIINLQSSFVQDENTAMLLEFVSSVRNDSGVEQSDNGMSQKVTARSGISLTKAANTPNPVTLRPYRTFSEVEQPASPFVFRVKSDEIRGIQAALFEADGSAWRHEAICAIRDYLRKDFDTVGVSAIILA